MGAMARRQREAMTLVENILAVVVKAFETFELIVSACVLVLMMRAEFRLLGRKMSTPLYFFLRPYSRLSHCLHSSNPGDMLGLSQ